MLLVILELLPFMARIVKNLVTLLGLCRFNTKSIDHKSVTLLHAIGKHPANHGWRQLSVSYGAPGNFLIDL